MSLADAAHVREQYQDASRLDARVGLYEGPVRVERRRTRLEITAAPPVVEYVRSVLPEGGARHEAFGRDLARRIERSGCFETVACAGLVRAGGCAG